MAGDPGNDFQGYMEDLQERQLDMERQADMLRRHEEWRQNTWSGWVVRMIQAIGAHFAPFFRELGRMTDAEENRIGNTILLAGLRALTIAAYVLAVYALARILTAVVGRTIVIEEEILIDHDADEDEQDGEGDNEDDELPEKEVSRPRRRRARDKKAD